MKRIVFICSIIIGASIFAQNPIATIPIANNPQLNEINPYLTKYWYEGFLSWFYIRINQVSELNPIWLAYIEVDSNQYQHIVAKNIGYDYKHNIHISDKYKISATETTFILRNPVIENFLGKPVAIWTRYGGNQTEIVYSVLLDSVWSMEQKIASVDSGDIAYVFFTHDASGLQHQSSLQNFFIWESGCSIYQTSLDADYQWTAAEKIGEVGSEIVSFDIRQHSKGDIWLIYDQEVQSDSIAIKLLILPQNESEWRGPFHLLDVGSKPSQSQINIPDFNFDENAMILGWVENRFFQDTLLIFEADTVKLESTENFPAWEQRDELQISSNTLLFGGCVTAPSPYYFASYKKDSLYWLGISQHSLYDYYLPVYSTKNKVSNLAFSGLSDSHYATAWVEYDSQQTDIYLHVGYIPIGDIDSEEFIQPGSVELLQNRPNPFNSGTMISYYLPFNQEIEIDLYDLQGRKVQRLFSGYQSMGNHYVQVNGRNLASGLYVYRLKTETGILSKKCLLVK